MTFYRSKYQQIIILIVFLIIAVPLTAYSKDKTKSEYYLNDITKLYEVYWLGMHVGDLTTSIQKTDNFSYKLNTNMQSLGLAKRLSKYWSVTESTTKISDDGAIEPIDFYTYSRLKKKKRKIELEFNEGFVVNEAVNPPDNRLKRPAVADAVKENSVDPHSAILLAYQKFRESLDNNETKFTFNVYDGRRLHKLLFEIKGRVLKKIYGHKLNVIHVRMSRQPVAGFTNNEMKRMQKEEPVFDVFVSNDDQKLPILFEASAPIGTAKIILAANCSTLENCKADDNVQTAFIKQLR